MVVTFTNSIISTTTSNPIISNRSKIVGIKHSRRLFPPTLWKLSICVHVGYNKNDFIDPTIIAILKTIVALMSPKKIAIFATLRRVIALDGTISPKLLVTLEVPSNLVGPEAEAIFEVPSNLMGPKICATLKFTSMLIPSFCSSL